MGLNVKYGFFLLFLLIAGCSSTSWVVQEEAVDTNDYEKVETNYFLQSVNGVHPSQPVVHFDLMAVETLEYTTRIKTERFIQRYKPRLGYVLLGMAGTGLSYYAALSDNLVKRPTVEQQYALMGAGTVLTGLSFLNMKPSGEPTETGETRLLRKTGTVMVKDTSRTQPYSDSSAEIRLSVNDNILAEYNEWPVEGERISINLAEELDAAQFAGNDNVQIKVEAYYDSLHASTKIPLSSIYERFVVVNSQLTALRNQPEVNSNNVLTDLAEGSQLELVETVGDWHKVLYGISENWVAVKDVQTIWRPSEFAADLSVIAIPSVPFGSVDVEQNIPVVGQSDLDASAFILSNYEYTGDLSERTYGQRDAKLMEEYFIQALGIRESRIIKATNVTSDLQTERAYSRLVSILQDEQNLTVYINGYAEVRDSKLYLIGVNHSEEETQYIDLHEFFKALNNLSLNSLIIYADLDIRNGAQNTAVLNELSSIITNENEQAAVIFSAEPGQHSGIYTSATGEKKRHSIFTYFLADAIKKRNTNLNDIINYLDRNVSFTSRSIYDRPQDPVIFGNRSLSIVD